MSRFTKYIKRGVHYILHGQPIVKVCPNIATLSQNELLVGRTALITGGTRGIGKAIAEAFLNSGANVVITSRKQSNADKVVAELKIKFPLRQIWGIELNNLDSAIIREKFENIINMIAPSKLSIVVNNAGILGGTFGNTNLDEFDQVINTNLKGVFFLSECTAEYMKEQHIAGNILMIASSSSLRPAVSAYTISKWGIRGFTLGLARICSPYGITVNGIAPGQTATEMIGKTNTGEISLKESPISRFVLPEEIAGMSIILCSDMGRSIVGDIVYMTGGAGLFTFEDIKYNF